MLIWTTRTILVFGKKGSWYGKTLPKMPKLEKVSFWDYQENELIHQGYVLKSSPLLGSTPQGLLFLINRHFWKFQTCPFWKKYAFPYIWALCDLYWILFDPYWSLFGPSGPYLALLGLIWPYLVPVGPCLVPIGPCLIPIGPYLIPLGPYLALLGLIWPWQLNKSVTQKVPTEDTEHSVSVACS